MQIIFDESEEVIVGMERINANFGLFQFKTEMIAESNPPKMGYTLMISGENARIKTRFE